MAANRKLIIIIKFIKRAVVREVLSEAKNLCPLKKRKRTGKFSSASPTNPKRRGRRLNIKKCVHTPPFFRVVTVTCHKPCGKESSS